MINKILKFLDMFGFICLSLFSFLVATIVMSKANIDISFLNELSEYELSVVVFAISGVIFLIIGIANMIYCIYQFSNKKEA